MNVIRPLRTFIASHQPLRVISRSIRNVFFPQKRVLNRMITVEVSTLCNARCIFCNYRFGYRKKSIMNLDSFRSIAESSIRLGYEDLSLTSMSGELFTHENAVQIIKAAKAAGFNGIFCFTNGILIHKHNIEELLTSGITHIFISFPGFSEKLYEQIFKVSTFSDFKKSIQMLLKTHKSLDSKVKISFLPRTYLTLREIKDSEFYRSCISHYISDLVDMDEPLYFYDTWGGDIDSSQLVEGMTVDLNPLKSIHPFKKTYPCNMMLRFGILVNGDVRLCNCRYDSTIGTTKDSLYIGNIADHNNLESFMLANKVKIEKMRHEYINGNMPALCKKCPMYTPVDFNSYFNYIKSENINR